MARHAGVDGNVLSKKTGATGGLRVTCVAARRGESKQKRPFRLAQAPRGLQVPPKHLSYLCLP